METWREQRTTSSLERVGTKVRKIFVAKSEGFEMRQAPIGRHSATNLQISEGTKISPR